MVTPSYGELKELYELILCYRRVYAITLKVQEQYLRFIEED